MTMQNTHIYIYIYIHTPTHIHRYTDTDAEVDQSMWRRLNGTCWSVEQCVGYQCDRYDGGKTVDAAAGATACWWRHCGVCGVRIQHSSADRVDELRRWVVDIVRQVVAAAAADDLVPVSRLIHGDAFHTTPSRHSPTFCRQTYISPLFCGPSQQAASAYICSTSFIMQAETFEENKRFRKLQLSNFVKILPVARVSLGCILNR